MRGCVGCHIPGGVELFATPAEHAATSDHRMGPPTLCGADVSAEQRLADLESSLVIFSRSIPRAQGRDRPSTNGGRPRLTHRRRPTPTFAGTEAIDFGPG